jgi:hypothetical protein
MSDLPARIKTLTDRLRRALARPRPRPRPHHWAVLASVGVAAVGLVSLRAIDLPSPRPLEDHDRLRIEVVPPVEPEIEPGSRMDVGDLVNGFRWSPPRRPSIEPIAYEDDPAWEDWREEPRLQPAWREPPPRHARESWRGAGPSYAPPRYARPEPDRRDGERRWFGFDEPRRDYRAEREDRRARYEARAEVSERRWEDREREWRARTPRDAPREVYADAYADDRPRRDPPPYERRN